MIQGVIFDIDGTLVDSSDAHAKSRVDTFANADTTCRNVVNPLIGMRADKLLPETVGIGHDGDKGKSLTGRESQ